MGRALHMRRDRQPGEGLDLRVSLCGMLAVNLAGSAVEVTCRLCRGRMAAVPAPEHDERIGEERQVTPGATALSVTGRRAIERSQRGEEGEAPRWRSLDAAFAMRRRVLLDGAPIRSSSDPDRFGHRVQTSGGGAVRTPSGREDVIGLDVAVERATRGPVDVAPGVTFPVVTQRAILFLRFDERLSMRQIADDLGGPWTAHHVSLMLRRLRATMVEDLVSRGVLEARELRRGGREKTEATMRIPGYDLEGWKEIAAHLGVHETTARTRLVSEGLPVVTARGKVFATKAGLDAWTRAQIRAVAS